MAVIDVASLWRASVLGFWKEDYRAFIGEAETDC